MSNPNYNLNEINLRYANILKTKPHKTLYKKFIDKLI